MYFFLFAPTLIYKKDYLRTESIEIKYIIKKLVIFIIGKLLNNIGIQILMFINVQVIYF